MERRPDKAPTIVEQNMSVLNQHMRLHEVKYVTYIMAGNHCTHLTYIPDTVTKCYHCGQYTKPHKKLTYFTLLAYFPQVGLFVPNIQLLH